ncbi:hypothetical protein P3T73_03490 [Kiritimatiellota bacterium B12222]|nr:hypothetical protein P3T73_03490 [Kiritimatiellota bacterium B12222]
MKLNNKSKQYVQSNHRYTVYIAVFVIVLSCLVGFAIGRRVGLQQVFSSHFTLKDGVIYTEEEVGISFKEFNKISQIFQHITIEGLEIQGEIISISVNDVVNISKEIHKIENVDPIRSITVLSETQVEVMTGMRRGPLSGGGLVYGVIKSNGKWKVTGVVNSWVS